MNRGNMRNQSRVGNSRVHMSGKPVIGQTRSGMHQKNEFEYRRAAELAENVKPVEEEVEDVLEIPEEMEEMIPEEKEEAVEPALISADEKVLEEAENVHQVSENEDEDSEQNGDEKKNPEQAVVSVDYSRERIPVLQPLTGGVDCEPVQLVYDSGDGEVRMIPDPLGVLSMEGIEPFFPEVKNPSANVPA